MEKFFDRKESSPGPHLSMLKKNGENILSRNGIAGFRSQKRAQHYASILYPGKQDIETWNGNITFYRDRNNRPSKKGQGSMSPTSRPSQINRLKLPELEEQKAPQLYVVPSRW